MVSFGNVACILVTRTSPTETGLAGWRGRNSNYGIHQDRNPFELPRESCPIWLKTLFRDDSSVSCAFASLQLRQGGLQPCPPAAELDHV